MRIDFDRPSTWLKYRSGLCDGCRANCCRLPVEVDLEDLIRLELVPRPESPPSLKKIARRLSSEGWVQNFRGRTALFILQQTYDGDCIFLSKDRKCTVYEKRPRVCRSFPEIGPRPGYCPSERIGKNLRK